MKKFLLVFALAVLSLSAHAFEASPSATVNGRLGAALRGSDSEGYTYWASYEVNGSDVTYVIYDYGFPTPDKTFTLKNVVTESTSPTYLEMMGGDDLEVIAVRGVFTDSEDRSWCVILYDRSNSKHYVYNENGENLGELPTNDMGSVGELMMSGIKQGPAVYVTKNEDTDSLVVWSFEGNNSIDEMKLAPSKIKAYPNPVSSGETLTVELPNPADANTIISVVDMNGKQLLNMNINAGQTDVNLSSDKLHNGVNIYTVIYKNGESYTGKVIKE